MISGRETILRRLAAATGRDRKDPGALAAMAQRLSNHPPGPIPFRGQVQGPARLVQFTAAARAAAATVAAVARPDEVPAAVLAFLRERKLRTDAAVAPDPILAALPWAREPALVLQAGAARPVDAVGITAAYRGIAETGSLLLRSGPDSPTTLAFLPPTHIAILWTDQVVGCLEHALAALRAEPDGAMPRSLIQVTGPSRSADIEQTLQLGAHGPRRLHIVLVDGRRPAR